MYASGTKITTAANTTVSRPIIEDPDGRFERDTNRARFQFAHGLTGHPLFALDSLVALAERKRDDRDTYWSTGRVGVGDGWDAGCAGRRGVVETVAGIADNASIVILKRVEQDPVYGPLLRDVLARVVDYAGETMRRDVVVGEVLVLVSSPNRVTPYHVDAESNFLFQVEGDKTAWVYDQNDRTLVTHADRAAYFAGNYNCASWRAPRADEGTAYDLRAGTALHIPVFAPHWVRNHANISVALSVNYELRSVHRTARVYRANAHLTRLGMTPRPPGESVWRDRMVAGAMAAASRAAALAERLSRCVPAFRV